MWVRIPPRALNINHPWLEEARPSENGRHYISGTGIGKQVWESKGTLASYTPSPTLVQVTGVVN